MTPYPWLTEVSKRFLDAFQLQRLHHAILLTGDRGLGKMALAQEFANVLLCREPQQGACGRCKACILAQAGTHPDFYRLQPEEDSRQIKIDQIRNLVQKLNQHSQLGGRKVVLVEPLDAMNVNSANSFLKCLEEPTPDTYFVLVCHRPERLLPTIRSRCQCHALSAPETSMASEWLQQQVSSNVDVALALRLSRNCPLQARALAESGDLNGLLEMLRDFYRGLRGELGLSSMLSRWKSLDPVMHILPTLRICIEAAIKARYANIETEATPIAACAKLLHQRAKTATAMFTMLEQVNAAERMLISSSNPNVALVMNQLVLQFASPDR